MSKTFALGIILSAKDMASSVLGKTSKNLLTLQKRSDEFKKRFKKIDKTIAPISGKIKDVDQALQSLNNRKLKLKQDFESGKISAEEFAAKMRRLEQIEQTLNSRKLRLKNELRQASSEAQRFERRMHDVERRIRIINGLNSLSRKLTFGGTAAAGLGVATRGMSETPVRSFVELEEAQTQLKIAMMKKGGKVSAAFAEITRQANDLGNKLPGSTTDFLSIGSTLLQNGVSERGVTGGLLKSSAYLAVVSKDKGVTYKEAATSVAKFQQSLSIMPKNMMKFVDGVQRMLNMGVDLTQMRYAFSKLGPALTAAGISGMRAFRDMSPMIGMLIQAGNSGETAGTALKADMQRAMLFAGSKADKKLRKKYGIRLSFTDRHGKFIGFHKMIELLEKRLKRFNKKQRLEILSGIFGTGEGLTMVNTLLNEGTEGIRRYEQRMAEQASLQKRVSAGLSTLGARWEAFTGTMENVFAIIGKQVSPALKWLTDRLGEFADKLTKLSETHPVLTKWASVIIVGFSAAMTVIGGLGIAFGIVAKGLTVFAGPLSKTIGGLKRLLGIKPPKGLCDAGGCAKNAATELAGLNKKTGALRSAWAKPLTLTVSLLGAAAVVAGLNEIAKKAHQNIADKRSVAPKAENIEALREKVKRIKERIAAAKGEDGWFSGAWESFTGGSNDKYKIAKLEKLYERAKMNLAKAEAAKRATAALAAGAATAAAAPALPPSPYEPSAAIKRAAAASKKVINNNQQHTYHVSVTVNGSTITAADVKAAVDQAMRDAAYHAKQRTMSDL